MVLYQDQVDQLHVLVLLLQQGFLDKIIFDSIKKIESVFQKIMKRILTILHVFKKFFYSNEFSNKFLQKGNNRFSGFSQKIPQGQEKKNSVHT